MKTLLKVLNHPALKMECIKWDYESIIENHIATSTWSDDVKEYARNLLLIYDLQQEKERIAYIKILRQLKNDI